MTEATKVAHTPGPWSVEVGESSAPGITSDIVRLDVVKGDRRIAGVTIRHGQDAEANARLIAAAPDLLDACTAAVGRTNGQEWTFDLNVYEMLCAAIAKATGEGA